MMKNKILALLIILILFSFAYATERRTWVNVGPVGGGSILPDRSDPNLWYSLAGNNEVFRSINGAKDWTKMSIPSDINIARFRIHPFDSTWYISTFEPNGYSLFVSKDRGGSFVHTQLRSDFLEFFIDPLNSNILYQTDLYPKNKSRSIYRSTDLGQHWEELAVNFTPSEAFGCPVAPFYIDEILPSPFDSNTIYLSVGLGDCPSYDTPAGFIVASHDGGRTWIDEFRTKTGTFKFLFDPTTPDRAYGYSQYNRQKIVVLTKDGWQGYSEPPCPVHAHCTISTIAVVPRQSTQLIVLQEREFDRYTPQSKICTTKDNGSSWEVADSPFQESQYTFYVSDTEPRYKLTSGSGGTYRKDKYWTPSNRGLQTPVYLTRIFSAKQYVYAIKGYEGHLLYRSHDAGKTWQDLRFQLPEGNLASLAIDPKNPKHLAIKMVRGRIYKWPLGTGYYYSSNDAGNSWNFQCRISHASRYTDAVAFDPFHERTILISAGHYVYKITEGKSHAEPLPLRSYHFVSQIYFDPRKPDTVFFINGHVYQSNDGGKTIYRSSDGLLPVDQGDPAGFIAGWGEDGYLLENDDATILRSLHGGTSWKEFSSLDCGRSGGNDPPGATPFYADDKNPDHFIGACRGYLWESTNGGRAWKAVNREFDIPDEYNWISTVSNPSLGPLYVINYYSGIWKAIERKENP